MCVYIWPLLYTEREVYISFTLQHRISIIFSIIILTYMQLTSQHSKYTTYSALIVLSGTNEDKVLLFKPIIMSMTSIQLE